MRFPARLQRQVRPRLGSIALATLIVATMVSPISAQVVSSIASNFNATPIKAGNFIWFSSVLNTSGNIPITISVRNATIEFTTNGTAYVLPVPDVDVTYSFTATSATTTYNVGTGRWESTLPFLLSGSDFLSGLAFQVPVDFPGGINPVVWSGEFSTSQGSICIQWKWGAAVYTSFTSDYGDLGVKPCDDNKASIYQNADHAGTPENFRPYVIGGARGGGGSNYTGSPSETASFCTQPVPAHPATWGSIKAGYR